MPVDHDELWFHGALGCHGGSNDSLVLALVVTVYGLYLLLVLYSSFVLVAQLLRLVLVPLRCLERSSIQITHAVDRVLPLE